MIARNPRRQHRRYLVCGLCLCLLTHTATPQSTSPQPPPADPLLQLSPQAAYDQALLPVVIVHRSVANWSASEAASLSVAVAQAQAFCRARPAAQFNNADLLGLARLCALGQQWNAVLDASNRLLATLPAPAAAVTAQVTTSTLAAPSPRAAALAFKIEAALNLQDPATALVTGQTLLATEPYSVLAQQITDTLLRYLQLIQTGDALNLAGKRLDRILPLLRASAPVPPAEQTVSASSQAATRADPATIPAHELYTAALAAPTLLQLEANAPAAAQTLATIEAALPPQLGSDETTLIELARRRYQLLSASLPPVPAAVSLFSPTETPRVDRSFGAATVLLVFPDWCAQCVRVGTTQFMPFLTRHAGEDIHLYGLLAQLHPPPVPAPPTPRRRGAASSAETPAAPDTSPTAADLLRGTPTLVVAATLPMTAFAATDFPLLVVTDHEGRIRYADTAPENAFIPGALVDQLITRVVELWPPPPGRHP